MTYVAWAALYEGATDRAYFDVLIPKIMEEIVSLNGIRASTIPVTPAVVLSRGSIGEVSREACQARDAFHICFIHADAGGRNLVAGLGPRSSAFCEAMRAECDWPPVRCIVISPRKETEAWILADSRAVTSALGYSGSPASIGLPRNADEAERLADPKETLRSAMKVIRGKRHPFSVSDIFPAIAQRQSLDVLRRANSFAAFEAGLRAALASLGCVAN